VLLVGCGVAALGPSAAAPETTRSHITGSAAPAPLSPALQGVTYYVALDGDDDDGSEAFPWRTVQHAVEQVMPGDTILVRSGTYAGWRIERSGTAQAWITLKAAPGTSVVVNAPGPENAHQSNVEVKTWEGVGLTSARMSIRSLSLSPPATSPFSRSIHADGRTDQGVRRRASAVRRSCAGAAPPRRQLSPRLGRGQTGPAWGRWGVAPRHGRARQRRRGS
jgi:hypothetical protein